MNQHETLTEKYLLEWAAYAINKDISSATFDGYGDVIQSKWNPLKNSSDAFELQLYVGRMTVNINRDEGFTLVDCEDWNLSIIADVVLERHDQLGVELATMLAITKSAARIGELKFERNKEVLQML